jgi:hypothetical protein
MRKTIVIMEAPDSITGIDQISDEHQFFLGAFGEVIGALRQIFPDGDFSDPTDVKVDRGENSLLIEINKHTPVQNFTIETNGELPVNDILKLCRKTGWRALDTDTGLFLDKAAAKENSKGKTWWRFWKK